MVVFGRWKVLARLEQESALAGVTAKENAPANAATAVLKAIPKALELLSKRIMLPPSSV
jgi:hypothetical protein